MRRSLRSLTLVEVVVILGIMAILVPLLVTACESARRPSRKSVCKNNLRQIGRAIGTYNMRSDGFFPFAWAPADVDPTGRYTSQQHHSGATRLRPKDSLTSLGLLYPGYLSTANVFQCPSTQDKPYLTVHWPTDIWDAGLPDGRPARRPSGEQSGCTTPQAARMGSSHKYRWDQRTWQLHESSYGYDCRVYPTVVSSHAIAGDMDGSYVLSAVRRTPHGGQNHPLGNHILYVDCHVEFRTDNYCSNDRSDNVYTESGTGRTGPPYGGWNADTDSYISDNTDPMHPLDDRPSAFDLSESYDDYPQLHP